MTDSLTPDLDANGLATSLRELAESIRARCNGDGHAAMLVAGKFAVVLDAAAKRLVGEPDTTRERELRNALVKYGRHQNDEKHFCAVLRHSINPCDCGFDDVVEGVDQLAPETETSDRCTGCDIDRHHCDWSKKRGSLKCCPECSHSETGERK